LLATPSIGGNVGELEELPPRVRPTQYRRDPPRSARRIVQLIVAAIDVGLQDTREAVKMPRRMLSNPLYLPL
jgi:hypothetical protein